MWKEASICIVIIIAIIIGNCITQNYTVQSVENLNSKLEELKQELVKNQNDIEIRNFKREDGRCKKGLGK